MFQDSLLWLGSYTIGAFAMFWAFFWVFRSYFKFHSSQDLKNHRNFLFAHRGIGFMLFGPVAWGLAYLLMSDPAHETGLAFQYPQLVGIWGSGLFVILTLVNNFVARTKTNQIFYPQVRYATWTPAFFALNAFTWALYLLGYEYLFRGVLFFPAVESLGLWKAIGLNVALYSLVHIPKGLREIVGAIPFGVVLCFAAYETGSFWVAFMAHSSQAVVNEYFSIVYNPKMRFGEREAAISRDQLHSGGSSH